MKKIVLTLSGGMDSATLLWKVLKETRDVHALAFNYGQKHGKEIEYAKALAERRNIPFHIVNLSTLKPFLAGSSQTSDEIEVPEGHYAEESMKKTVVPNRNMIMLSVATAFAISIKANAVAYAAQAGDNAIYPDCRPEFAEALAEAIWLADWHQVQLETPFIGLTKAEICKVGYDLGVPFAETWSCYKGQDRHCGKCGTCVERKEAFELAGVPDPTQYE